MTDAAFSRPPDGADRAADPNAAVQEAITAADLDGRAAVITGGAKRIGLAIAARLAGLGMKLCLADTDAGALEKARDTLVPLLASPEDLCGWRSWTYRTWKRCGD